jgi:hypothetical protein
MNRPGASEFPPCSMQTPCASDTAFSPFSWPKSGFLQKAVDKKNAGFIIHSCLKALSINQDQK